MKNKNIIVKNRVILNLIQDLRRRLLLLLNDLRGRGHSKFGMTCSFNQCGFTLIELLVVVLIIGILAAVALPQYQKAVEKSRIVEMQTILTNLEKVAEMHRLTKGLDDTFNPITDGDIDYSSQFVYDEGNDIYCNAREICIDKALPDILIVTMRKKSEHSTSSQPDYGLWTQWDSTQNKWIRGYFSCGENINSYGLENVGYTHTEC